MKWAVETPNQIPTFSDLISEYFSPKYVPKKRWWQFWRKSEIVPPRSKYRCHMWHCLHHEEWVVCKTMDTRCTYAHSCTMNVVSGEPTPTDYLLIVDDIEAKIVWHDGTELLGADPEFFTKLEVLLDEVERQKA